jgi:hypothetical protein
MRCAYSERRPPGFTVTATLALAAGIGASCAIFSLLDAAKLRPLPFRERAVGAAANKNDRNKRGDHRRHTGLKGNLGHQFALPGSLTLHALAEQKESPEEPLRVIPE